MSSELFDVGRFDPRYLAFIDTVAAYRARLHRYCARMTGSVLDGEDVMQGVLFEAYRKLDHLQDGQDIAAWLFRIAHNRSIDFIRRRTVRQAKEAAAAQPDVAAPAEIHGHGISHALERIVIHLPPKERACVLLKDVFDHSLEEIADLVDSTVGGVKAALHRGRGKLAALPVGHTPPPARPEVLDLHARYVEHFNRQDWDGIRQLIRADARLLMTGHYAGPLLPHYFTRFDGMLHAKRMVMATLDGEPVLVLLGGMASTLVPQVVVRFEVEAGRIQGIRHYAGCPWVLAAARELAWTGGAAPVH